MRIRNAASVAAIVVSFTAMAAPPALAASPAPTATGGVFHPEPWQPFTAQDFVAPAGKYCTFDLAVEAVEDEEEVRVDARYPDGTVRVYEYRGKLISRFTNLATGESVVRDLSGRGWQELYADGTTSKSFTGIGPFSAGFRAQDRYPQGYYRLDGFHSIDYTPDGIRSMPIAAGPEENLCRTVS